MRTNSYRSGSASASASEPVEHVHSVQRLSKPVIIPQRRPETRERGFIYAYAPVLNDCGIDEASFLTFLDNLNQACKVGITSTLVRIDIFDNITILLDIGLL
jgi:hypothetical protein